MGFLDDLPVASITFLVSLAVIVIYAIAGEISFDQAFEAIALAGGGSAAIGFVRNGAGRGVRR
jgi:hypothetical protein